MCAGRKLAANLTGLDEEYFEALEAFEAVQAHDYLVRAAEQPPEEAFVGNTSDAPSLPAEEDDASDEQDDDGETSSPALTARYMVRVCTDDRLTT